MASKNTINKRVNIYINGREVTNDIKSIRAEMQKAVNEQAKMTIGSEEYIQKTKEIRQFKAIIQEHNRQLQTTQQKWFSLGKAVDTFNKYSGIIIGLLGSLTGIVLGFRKCADEAAKFEENLDNLSALTGLEGKNLDWLGDQAKEMSVKTTESGIKIKQSATDILDAFTKMGSQRPELLKNKEALAAVTEDAIILSEASKMKLEPATASLANVMNQFNEKSSSSRRIINELAAGSQAGSGDIQYLSDAIEKCGTSAYLMGMKTNQTIGVIEAVAPKFKEASQAGNSLDKVLLKMKEKQIGYQSGLFNLNDALNELQTRFAQGESSATIFGVEHAKMAEVLVLAKDDVIKYTETVTSTNKALEQAAKNTNNRITERAQAMNKLKLKMIEVGEEIAPAITMSTNAFTYFLNAIVKAPTFYKQHSQLIWTLIAAFIALQGKAILSAASSLKDQAAHLLSAAAKKKNALATLYLNTYTEQYNKTQGRLHPALLKARTAFTMLGRAMLANPIGTAIAAFTALKAAITFYDKNNATSIRLEKEKKAIMDGLNQSINTLSEKYKTYQTQISTLNRLSNTEKKALLEKLDLTIQNTEAELANYRAKKLRLQAENTRPKVWDMFINTLKSMGNVSKTMELNLKSAFENGKKSAEELDPILEKIEETLTGLKNQKTGLSDILEAEATADKIGTQTITELQEKVNLYRTALENATVQSEEYIRIQQKLIDTEKLLNSAIKNRDISTIPSPNKNDSQENSKLAAEKKIAQAITAIRQKLNLDNLTESEKEILQSQQKYSELLALCRQFGLDTTEITKVHEQEINAIIDKSFEDEVSASISAYEQINRALMSSSEREKADIRQKYQELITLAKQYGIDTVALKNKMDEELSAVKEDEEPHDIFDMSPEDWEDLQGKITMAIDMASQLSNIWGQFNQIQANREKKELQDYEKSCNRKKELLNKQLNSGRISQEQYNARVSQLDADLEKKKTEIAKKQAKRDKATAITNAIINTASAIVRIWADVPKGDFGIATAILTALAAATGAAQIAVIANQPLPEYADGGMTKGAKMYIAGEAGQEWIAPNDMLQDPITGPIINRLEMVRSGIISPEQLILPDFQTMNSVPLYSSGGYTYTSHSTSPNNYYTTETTNIISDQHLESIDEKISKLIEYLSDPKNRQATISNDLLKRNEEELNTMNRLKRL